MARNQASIERRLMREAIEDRKEAVKNLRYQKYLLKQNETERAQALKQAKSEKTRNVMNRNFDEAARKIRKTMRYIMDGVMSRDQQRIRDMADSYFGETEDVSPERMQKAIDVAKQRYYKGTGLKELSYENMYTKQPKQGSTSNSKKTE